MTKIQIVAIPAARADNHGNVVVLPALTGLTLIRPSRRWAVWNPGGEWATIVPITRPAGRLLWHGAATVPAELVQASTPVGSIDLAAFETALLERFLDTGPLDDREDQELRLDRRRAWGWARPRHHDTTSDAEAVLDWVEITPYWDYPRPPG